MRDRVAIIDLDSVAFSIGIGNKVVNSLGEPEKVDGKFVYVDKTEKELEEAADYWMNKILTDSGATGYIAFIKGKGNFRYAVKSDYKSNRPKESPHWWNKVKSYLISKWHAIPVNGIEVDDAVNIARRVVENSFICAIDKDLLELESINPHFNWRKGEWSEVTKESALTKFWSDMIAGQPGDAIKGLPGKGVVFAKSLFTLAASELIPYHEMVFSAYIKHFGERIGIQEFYKNYMSLRILEDMSELPLDCDFKPEMVIAYGNQISEEGVITLN